ncbi:transmembrane protein [Thalictrum thalictroides]|uniref:Transmembrane protein n=1 Tax=Thalictrum thalictroides TaxID=46969 RepID=A0A7J6UZA1_THATH|nr:transmembrane protein [Thalictrum thalictroides]
MFHDHHYHNHHLPCLHCYPNSFIRVVQNLIERCLLLRMNQDDCVIALARHASIHPLITLTVWKELQKENRDFFQSYLHAISPRTFNYRPFQRETRFRRGNSWK